MKVKNIAILASGSGTNAQKIIEYFQDNSSVKVKIVISNKADAYVLERAKEAGIHSLFIPNSIFKQNPEQIIEVLKKDSIDLIVLAGFLLLIPEKIIKVYPKRIINIHPALLPKYGGKGMYGKYVHAAVKNAGELSSGISIHYVDDKFDEGEVIFQKSCDISHDDSAEDIANKVLKLEHEYYPQIIENIVNILPE